MLKNTQINRIATKMIAQALGELNNDVVYVGGSVVSFYVDDPAADDVRPTKDIDITFEIRSLRELEVIRLKLTEKGFYQSSEDSVICRFRFDDILVDVMSTEAVGWAPANVWFSAGFMNKIQIELDTATIQVMPYVYFLATKFSAYLGRGNNDPIMSKDYEDIVYLLNHTLNLAEHISKGNNEVQLFLRNQFEEILSNGTLQEAMIAHLFHEDQFGRLDKILSSLRQIIVEIDARLSST